MRKFFTLTKQDRRGYRTGWFINLFLFRRPEAELGEFAYRFNLTVGVATDDRDRVLKRWWAWRWIWDCVTVPAWLDEPTVVAEDAANRSRLSYRRFGHRGLA